MESLANLKGAWFRDPDPATWRIVNADCTRSLARVLRRPALIPVPGAAVRLALGELAGELLGSRRVVPRRMQQAGFQWTHPGLESALRAELAPRD